MTKNLLIKALPLLVFFFISYPSFSQDNDQDTVINREDQDDDNDGILDIDEGVCFTTPQIIPGSEITALANGSGTSGTPSVSYQVPDGVNRMLLVLITVERDHTNSPYGDNWESNWQISGDVNDRNTIFFGGVPMTLSRLRWSQINAGSIPSPADSYHSSSSYVYTLFENDIPSGTNSFDFSEFITPTNSGDEFSATILTFEGVSHLEFVAVDSSHRSSSTTWTLSGVAEANNQPIGTTADQNLLFAYASVGTDSGITGSSNWTNVINTINSNNNGTYATDPNITNTTPENDGISTSFFTLTGVTGNQSITLTTSFSTTDVLHQHIILFRLVGFAIADDDNDGVANCIDLDSDNDGIPDNIEAQPTNAYISPTGSVNPTTGILTVYGNGLIPEDTDNDNTFDFIDLDSDNDGKPDIVENGILANAIITPADNDIDGLDNIFETNGTNDAIWDVNEDIEDPTDLTILLDADNDLALGGDLDYRDALDTFFVSGSLDFDGIDDHVIGTPIFSSFNESNTDGVTLMAWVKSDSDISDSTQKFLLGEENAIEITLEGETIKAAISYVNSDNTTDTKYVSRSTSGIQRGIWRHVAVTVSFLENKATLYLDGEFVYSIAVVTDFVAFKSSTTAANEQFRMGNDSNLSASRFFKGSIDEVRVFNTIMLESEIKQIVFQEIENQSSLVQGTIVQNSNVNKSWSNLEMYFPLSNILSGTIPDESIYGHDAHMYNITTIQEQTAPMPFTTKQDGNWHDKNTWLHGDVWYIPGDEISEYATYGDDETLDWGIYHIKNTVTATTSMSTNITALALEGIHAYGVIIDQKDASNNDINFTIGDATSNIQLNVSKYLQLDGVLDLKGDSQLVQGINSDLVTSATGKILRRQEGNLNYFWYNYWSSPVGALATTNNTNTDFKINMLKDDSGNLVTFTSIFDNPGDISTQWLYKFQNGITYNDWATLTPNTNIAPGVGFTHKGTNNANGNLQYIFDGKPNNGTILLVGDDVDNDNLGIGESVQDITLTTYLVGNPYPSALDAREFINDNTPTNGGVTSGTIFVWEQWAGNNHLLEEYQGGYATINMASTAPAYQWNDATTQSVTLPTFYIPVAQGFFVEIVEDGDIKFNNSQRIFIKEADADGSNPNNGSVFFRTTESSTSNQTNDEQIGIIRLNLNVSNGNQRNFVLAFSDFTTDGFDYGYDSRTIDPQVDDMGSYLDNEKMVIQSFAPITNDKVVDLVFNSTGTFNYTIEMSEISNIPEDQEVFLRDNLTNTYFDLRSGAYSFSSDFDGEDTERFDIVFQSGDSLSNEEFLNDNTFIYVNNIEDMLYVKNLSTQAKKLSITNVLGQTINTYNNVSIQTLKNGLNISNLITGMYVVSIQTENNQSIDKKIIVK